jgi:hypothetical protein
VGSGALLGDERPLDLDTCEGVDYLGHGFLHRVYGFYHGRITYVRLIMMCMHV